MDDSLGEQGGAAAGYAGGCCCGAARDVAPAVFDAGYCHCSVCRRISGAAAACRFSVREEDFELTAGSPAAPPEASAFRRVGGVGGEPTGRRRRHGHRSR